MKTCSIGIRVHSGWGAVVAVAGAAGAIEVVERRRIEIVDGKARGAAQPYHFARDLDDLGRAEQHLASSAAASNQLATTAMRQLIDELQRQGYRVVGAAILLSSGRAIPVLEKILASHPMIHTAEGAFFRKSFAEACAALKIPSTGIIERDLDEHAKEKLGRDAGALKKRISTLGKVLGPPWTTDQKAAALAGAIVLAEAKK